MTSLHEVIAKAQPGDKAMAFASRAWNDAARFILGTLVHEFGFRAIDSAFEYVAQLFADQIPTKELASLHRFTDIDAALYNRARQIQTMRAVK